MFKYFLSAVLFLPLLLVSAMPEGGICAHQGDIANFPNNTIPAFKSALKLGAAMIEFDIKRCKTGELVVFHDTKVDKLTDGRGDIREMTFAEVRKLKVYNKAKRNAPPAQIPTFQEVLDCMPRDGVWLNIHSHDVNNVIECAKILKKENRLHQAFISTNIIWGLKARKVVPELKICNLNRPGKRNVPWTAAQHRKYAQDTVKYKCEFVQPIQYFPAHEVKFLHDNGTKISFFQCNDPKEVKKILDNGADFIFTNRLKLIKDEYDKIMKNRQNKGVSE